MPPCFVERQRPSNRDHVCIGGAAVGAPQGEAVAQWGTQNLNVRMAGLDGPSEASFGKQRMGDPAVGRARRGFPKKKPPLPVALELVAERTGLEPATPGVTGRVSDPVFMRLSGRFDVQRINIMMQKACGSCSTLSKLFLLRGASKILAFLASRP
jgi:hypothetical protein